MTEGMSNIWGHNGDQDRIPVYIIRGKLGWKNFKRVSGVMFDRKMNVMIMGKV